MGEEWWETWCYDENIICPYCGKEYEPSYEETYIGGEPVECYEEGNVQTVACDRCGKRFTVEPHQPDWHYTTETIDGEATEEEIEAMEENGW